MKTDRNKIDFMKLFICFALASLLIMSCGDNKNNKKEAYKEQAKKELTLLNDQYDSAMIKADTAWMKRVYSDDFTYTTPEGQVRNKSQQLENISSGGLKLEFGKSDDVTVNVYDSTAIVMGRFMGKGVFKENIIDIKERYTTVWMRQAGKWKLVTEQGSFIKQ